MKTIAQRAAEFIKTRTTWNREEKNMIAKRVFACGLVGAVLVGGICSAVTRAAEEPEKPRGAAPSVKPQRGRVTGILVAKDDKSITVKAEGAKESTRYLLPTPGSSKTDVRAALKAIFVPNLVAIGWEGQDEPVVTAVSAIMPKQRTGVVTGTIVAQASGNREVYIDVKPAGRGFTERYWPAFVGKSRPNLGGFDKQAIETIAKLKVGDRVRVAWYCDERKRASQVKVIAPAPKVKPKEKESE
jgi:hypothetical protein